MATSQRSEIESSAAKGISALIPRQNVMRYSIVRQVLWGKIKGVECGPYHAPSGGGQDGIKQNSLRYKDWNPGKKKTGMAVGHRGGAIMPGWWIMVPEDLAKGEQSSFVGFGKAPTSASLRIIPYELVVVFCRR